MLEAGLNQGAGLHALAVHSGPRVVAMASHGDRSHELPLLCGLCTAWTELGYPVVVLDATLAESGNSPGLEQLLASAGNAEIPDRGASIWPILPAATGLEQLCRKGPGASFGWPPLQQLGSMFRDYEIVLVYANARDLAAYMPDSGIEPLLTVSTKRMSLLSAYQALKQLLIIGRLPPTMVAVMNEINRNSRASAHSMFRSLQDCAMGFLGHQITLVPVAAQSLDGHASEDISRLALRLLERAVSLGRGAPPLLDAAYPRASGDNYFSRSH
jgi:hypothetical protein